MLLNIFLRIFSQFFGIRNWNIIYFLKPLKALGRETQEGTWVHLFIQAGIKENLLHYSNPLKR